MTASAAYPLIFTKKKKTDCHMSMSLARTYQDYIAADELTTSELDE
jgi:hypothetical protein